MSTCLYQLHGGAPQPTSKEMGSLMVAPSVVIHTSFISKTWVAFLPSLFPPHQTCGESACIIGLSKSLIAMGTY